MCNSALTPKVICNNYMFYLLVTPSEGHYVCNIHITMLDSSGGRSKGWNWGLVFGVKIKRVTKINMKLMAAFIFKEKAPTSISVNTGH